MNSSTNTWSSSLKAFSIANPTSSEGLFTLLIPMLEPPLFGFTNTGNFNWLITSSGLILPFLKSTTDFATLIPENAATATVYLLLKVSADVAASQLV